MNIKYILNLVPKVVQYYCLIMFAKHNILIMCRQVGKTTIAILWLFTRLLFTMRRNPMGLVYSLTDGQVRKNVFYPMIDMLRYLPKSYVHIIKNELVIRIKRPFARDIITIYFSGIEKGNNLRGDTCDAMLLDEVQFFSKNMVEMVLLPFCKDRDAPWLMISTVDDVGWFWSFCKKMAKRMLLGNKDICVLEIDIEDSLDSTKEAIDELKKTLSYSGFQGQYKNNPYCSVKGVIFAEEWSHIYKNNIGNYAYDPRYDLFTLWDLGVGRNLVCFVMQYIEGKYICINTLIGKPGEGTAQVCGRLKDEYRTVNYFFLPHDGDTRSKVNGVSHRDLIKDYFGKSRVMVAEKPSKKSVRIDKARPFLYKLHADRMKCLKHVRHMAKYAWAENSSGKLTGEPDSSESSHYCDALTVLGGFGERGVERYLHGYQNTRHGSRIRGIKYRNSKKSLQRLGKFV